MKQNFTGYRVPKTLDFNKITVFEDIELKKDEKLKMYKSDKYYYIFYNNIIKNYAIPQLCNNKNENEIKDLKSFLNYLKKPMTEKEVALETIYNIRKIFKTIESGLAKKISDRKKIIEPLTDEEIKKLEISGKFKIKRATFQVALK